MRRSIQWVACGSVLVAASCTGMEAVGSMALNLGRNLLLNTAQSNFGEKYTEDIGKLVDLLLVKELGGDSNDGTKVKSSPLMGSSLTGASTGEGNVPLQLDIAVLRKEDVEGMSLPIPVEDGDILRDGVGRESDGDNLKIQFTAGSDCYVYAVWIDATSWATPLFPVGPGYNAPNPVQTGRRYTFPEGDQWFYLDNYRGAENLYFMASREPIDDLSVLLAQLAVKKREFRIVDESPVTIDEPTELSRGLAGVRTGAGSLVQTGTGQETASASQLFVATDDANQLVVTRWFRHE